MSSRKSLASRRRGFSNAHAFAVGKATGVRINDSHAANVGAALHSSKKHRENARRMSRSSNTSKHKFSSSSFSQNAPLDVLSNFDELKAPSFKYFYLLLIPIVIFLITIFVMMVLSIARII